MLSLLLLLLLLLHLNQLLLLSLAPLPMLRRKLLPLLSKLCHHSARHAVPSGHRRSQKQSCK